MAKPLTKVAIDDLRKILGAQQTDDLLRAIANGRLPAVTREQVVAAMQFVANPADGRLPMAIVKRWFAASPPSAKAFERFIKRLANDMGIDDVVEDAA